MTYLAFAAGLITGLFAAMWLCLAWDITTQEREYNQECDD